MKYITGKVKIKVKNKGLTYMKVLSAVLLVAMSGLLTACSTDDVREKGNKIQLAGFTRTGDEGPVTVTSDYSPVRLYFVSSGSDVISGNFSYVENENVWKSNIEDVTSGDYAVYGYAPATAATATLSEATPTSANLTLANVAALTLANVAAVTANDVCVVIGVQTGNVQTGNTSTPKDVWTNWQGNLMFSAAQGNFLYVLMDHVLSAVRFEMTLDADYAKLRSIKLKKMELQSTKGSLNITMKLTSKDDKTSPISDFTYGSLTETGSHAVFFEDAAGVALNATEYTAATCCFAPGASSDLSLTTTYDVYDRKGNYIGERTATNKLPDLGATRGQRVKLKLTITPTYLNVLSDPDADYDNPKIKIE